MNQGVYHIALISAIKTSILSLFFLLGLLIISNYNLRTFIADLDSDSIENTSNMDEQEKESENENENENEEEEDDKLEDFLRITIQDSKQENLFSEAVFLHLNSHSLHFGDTFTPPPDKI